MAVVSEPPGREPRLVGRGGEIALRKRFLSNKESINRLTMADSGVIGGVHLLAVEHLSSGLRSAVYTSSNKTGSPWSILMSSV
jgi:hypothetical protein